MRVVVVVVGAAERRREQHRASRPGLVVVVDDLREPLPIENPVDVLRLRLVRHVEVAVVVVPDVLLVEAREPGETALLRRRLAHVPFGDQVVAVRVRVRAQHDDVVQESQRLRVGSADQHVDRLGDLLRTDGLGRVQAAVEPHHGFALGGQRARLLVGQPLGQREPSGDRLVARQSLVVLGRRDDGHVLGASLGRPADVLQHHAVRFPIEPLPVIADLLVRRDVVVVAQVEAEELLRRRDLRLCEEGRGRPRENGRRQEENASPHVHRYAAPGRSPESARRHDSRRWRLARQAQSPKVGGRSTVKTVPSPSRDSKRMVPLRYCSVSRRAP